jgi:hypothetical protein
MVIQATKNLLSKFGAGPKAKDADEATKKDTPKNEISDKAREAAEEMSKKITPKVEKSQSHFTDINDEAAAKELPGAAAKIMKAFKIFERNDNYAFVCKDNTHLSLVIDADTAEEMTKTGALYKLFGWGRFFGGFDKSTLANFAKKDSLVDLIESDRQPENVANIMKEIKAHNYKLNITFEADESGKFSMKPKAIALMHDYKQVAKNLKENPPEEIQKHPEAKAAFEAEIDKITGSEALENMYVVNTVLVDPEHKDAMFGSEKAKDEALRAFAEGIKDTVVFPTGLYNSEEVETETKLFSTLNWDHFYIDKDNKFKTSEHPLTIARPLAKAKQELPEDFRVIHRWHVLAQANNLSKVDKGSNDELVKASKLNGDNFKRFNEQRSQLDLQIAA